MTSSIKLSSEEEHILQKNMKQTFSMFNFGDPFTINNIFYTVIGGKVCNGK